MCVKRGNLRPPKFTRIEDANPDTPKSDEERRVILERFLETLAGEGLRVESRTDTVATVVEGRPVEHKVHGVLTLATFGVWALVWGPVTALGGEQRSIIAVDECGNIDIETSPRQPLGKRR